MGFQVTLAAIAPDFNTATRSGVNLHISYPAILPLDINYISSACYQSRHLAVSPSVGKSGKPYVPLSKKILISVIFLAGFSMYLISSRTISLGV